MPSTAEPLVAGMALTLHTGHKPGGLWQPVFFIYIGIEFGNVELPKRN